MTPEERSGIHEVKAALHVEGGGEAYAEWTLAEVESQRGPLSQREKAYFAPKVLGMSAIERVMSQHGPARQYERTTTVPQCRQCRQSWPCDTAHLVRTLIEAHAHAHGG